MSEVSEDPHEAEARVKAASRQYWKALIGLAVVLFLEVNAILGWMVWREVERQHRLDTNEKILKISARSGVQLDCFVDVYFIHPTQATTDDERRQALVECVTARLKGLPR